MLRYAALSDVGLVRRKNEDSYYIGCPLGGLEENLFIVADGMGGHRGGCYASRFVVQKIPQLLKEDPRTKKISGTLLRAVENTNAALYKISKEDEELEGMGSTLVMALCYKKRWELINVGDSRAYVWEGESLRQITQDHSLVEEMVRAGRLNREDPLYQEQKHVITRAMGIEPLVMEDAFSLPLREGQRLLLCSDGLHGMVSDEAIAAVLKEEADTERAAGRLLDMALEAGGRDNITLILIDYQEENE